MLSVVDLFAGAGGLSLGFEQTKKYCIKVAFENNPAMQETYKLNHPDVEVRGDVYEANYEEIKKTYGPIDVVIGGPPCQGFSNANRQRNAAVSHNNALVKEYVRAIKELNPMAFVMENVSMLRSDIHRFYLSEADQALVDSGTIETKSSRIPLLEQEYLFDGVLDIVKNEAAISSYLWPEQDYTELNILYKATKNIQKLVDALFKYKNKLLKIVPHYIDCNDDSPIRAADAKAFAAIQDYFADRIHAYQLKARIEPAIMYQRMLSHSKEIFDNHLVVDAYTLDNGLFAEIRSFAVHDYIKAMLGEGDDGYAMNADVLCAANYGAPQKRMRFIMVGIKKSITSQVKLPKGSFTEENYRTVYDAIADLEDVEPVYDIADDVGIKLGEPGEISELAKKLRNSKLLRNHIITRTTDVAMERFKALQQGENFHALDNKLKTNTYTDVARTQNTIYLRLDYSQPSGTVVNVRKSMWIHPTKDRAISIREAARLQTFPDSFAFTGTKDKQYQQVGNAVPPIMAKAIAKKLASQLNNYIDAQKEPAKTDNHSPEVRSYNMSQIRSTETKPEILVRQYLFSKGFRFRKNDARLPGKPDVYLPKYKTVIFVSGCFWHQHEGCRYFVWPKSNADYWKKKISGNVERDRRNYDALKQMGYRVLIVWECELKKESFDSTMEELVRIIKS